MRFLGIIDSMKESVRTTVRQILTSYLEMNNHRKTPERYAILDAVYDINGHFTLDELGEKLSEENNFPVSRATLYNTLKLFMELRLVIRHRFQGQTKYEACYDNNSHSHQICTMCGKVTEIKAPQITETISNMHLKRFRKDGFSLYIYGICSACQAKITRIKAQKKSKVVDVLTPQYDVVARFQGGPNAGHTLEFEGQKYVLRSIPSGIFQGGKVNIIGNGVVLAPDLFMEEAKALEASGHELKSRLHISKKAHLIMPTHRVLDAAYEAQKGKDKVGTTGKGIGPTYTDKVSRNGLRVGDILENFDEKYAKAKARHDAILKSLNFDYDITEVEKKWLEGIEYLRQFPIVDSEHEINNLLKSGKSVLCEGAQGTMLDIDFGSYPFVTSSNTICAGACTGLGIGPNKIGDVYGIMKAYCTRVGAGPFPTELFDETGKKIRDLGHEYGAVTGRERRCGWIDLIALKYSIMVNGVTQLIMMKSDVLDDFDTIKACVAYKQNGQEIDYFPYNIEEGIEPVYKELPGWKTDMTKFTSEDQFPQAFKDYIKFLEAELETPIKIISIGPDRDQTIVRK